jgi:hypothetical protein
MEYSCDDKRLVFGIQKFSSNPYSRITCRSVGIFRVNENGYDGNICVTLRGRFGETLAMASGIESWNILFWQRIPERIHAHELIVQEWISNIDDIKNTIYKDSTEDIPIPPKTKLEDYQRWDYGDEDESEQPCFPDLFSSPDTG